MSITITSGVIVMLLLLSSCGGKKKAMGEAITERDSLPMMTTLGVTTLISDSGVTRYRVNTEEWSVYDRKKPSYWAFEKGVYLDRNCCTGTKLPKRYIPTSLYVFNNRTELLQGMDSTRTSK